MRLSDYIIEFLRDRYHIDTIFTVSGGGCIFLIDSLGKTENIRYIATHHEQAAAIAAEGYARINNKLGVCIVTSGPGGTNAITGTLCSWLDSIPVIVISGQVNKNLTTNFTKLPLRQLGDQEFNIIESIKNITKYAVQVNDPSEIRYHLEKACMTATSGRPGPVWLDIPLDVQSTNINPQELLGFNEEKSYDPNPSQVIKIVEKWNSSEKPLLIIGNGVRLSGGVDVLKKLLEKTKIPTITAVNGNDIVNSDYRQYYGRFGTHAQICANKLLSECDFLLSIGSRLYVRQIGYNFQDFAKQAFKAYVDIDENELTKPTIFPDISVCSDAKLFIEKLLEHNLSVSNSEWINECDKFNSAPKVLECHRNKTEYVSHYAFIERLSDILPDSYHIVTSDGSANVVTMQVMNLTNNRRMFTNTGCAPMGYGLPAAIGASVHHDILCLEGDGSLHLNVHELQTMKHYNLPIKLVILNNDGYLSIKISQNTFFNGKYVASDKNSGVSFPNFKELIQAYKLPYFSIKHNSDIDKVLKQFFNNDGPAVCEVFTDPSEYHEPKVMASISSDGKFIPGKLENIEWISKS